MPILALESVFGGGGATTIVEGVSLELAAGEVVSIVGRNGVGKTSTLEIVMGRAKLFSGRVLLDGVPIQDRPTFERCRAGLSYVPQGREVFPSLTVAENLSAAARPGEWTMARVFDLFPALRRRAGNFGRQLSGGEQQMLSIGRALIGNPKVLLMDEPTEGLAPIVVEEVVEAIKQLASSAAFAVLLVEQVLDVALELSDRCLVMDRGQIVFSASADELQRSTESFHKALGFF